MPPSPRVELITTGEELLIGLTANSHLSTIGDRLARRGVRLQRNIVVPDDAESIGAQFRESWSRADIVITTGGLGPTSDDRTREVIAEALGQRLVFDGEAEAAIRRRFEAIGRKMTPNNLRQAYRPEHGAIIRNPHGTAPGIWVEQDGKVLIMLPGPPNELIPMLEDEVIPRLAARGLLGSGPRHVQIRTAGLGESALETMLEPVFASYPGVEVAYCAHLGCVDVRLSSPDGRYSPTELQIIANHCRERLGGDFVCFGEDSLVKLIADHLRLRNQSLAVAESCTGGLLSHAFTDFSGASKLFRGAVVCYCNDCKVQLLGIPECLIKQHGAVSAEVAAAMAAGVAEHLEADYGLAITGYAGPCCREVRNRAGTVYIGLHTPHGIWSRKVNYPGSRDAVKQRAVNAALDWLRRELVRASSPEALPAPSVPETDPAREEALRLLGIKKK